MNRPEQSLHRAVAQYLEVALDPRIPWTTIGHGGGGKVRGAILKSMGVKPGWPDIMIFLGPQTIFLELKSPKGATSAHQKMLHMHLRARGAFVAICRSVEEVEDVLCDRGLPVRATVKGDLKIS